MAYNETYSSSDTSPIILDLLGTALVAIVGFGSLVGLIVLYRWARGKKISI